MILRGFTVENWRCIRRLELNDLAEGVMVLHGPNRTGKLSLVLALRCALFDDHDSAKEQIRTSVPWQGSDPPKVVVQFATLGAEYRLTKVFSKRKDGAALLEKKAGSIWQTEQDAPKEAARKVRELLDADKSTAGLNQLLWLEQGDVRLPDQKGLDGSLQKKLVDVLGVMVTGHDLEFEQELNKCYGKWYTGKTGNFKKDSPVNLWEQERLVRIEMRDKEKAKLESCEAAIRQLQDCEDRLPALKHAVEQSRNEVTGLEQEREQGRERVRKYREAEKALETATTTLTQAEKALENHRQANTRRLEEERKFNTAQEQMHVAQDTRNQWAVDHAEKFCRLEEARVAEQNHQKQRDELDDRRKLLLLCEQQAQADKVLASVVRKENEIRELEEKLRSVPAPDEKAIGDLRINRRKAEGLGAQLAASALTLSVSLNQQTNIIVSLDGQPGEQVAVPAAEKRSWSLRQRAEIAIADIGIIALARSQQNLDVERAAQDLARLDRDFQDAVRAFQQDPANETCLDLLTECQMQRKTWTQRLHECRNELQNLAPQGPGALKHERNTLDQRKRLLLGHHPELDQWQPDAIDMENREKEFKDRAVALEAERKSGEAGEQTARQNLQKADDALQALKVELAGFAASLQASAAELQRLGDEAVLLTNQNQAQASVAQARQTLAENQLTEAEKTIEYRHAEARAALDQRENRLRELETDITRLRGVLQGNEGLHIHLADAEAALQEAESALAREKLEAEAHKLLRTLFDECRDKQVQKVMGPVAGRVLDWCHKIGLEDCREVRFGDKFLPEGILLQSSASDAPVLLDEESYGTGEQLSLLVRLALGGLLARDEPVTAILDDPLAHADVSKHRRILEILHLAAEGGIAGNPPAGRMQIIILTCHPDRFDHLAGARQVDLRQLIKR